jgi:isopentenyl-diphosphate Delta-isomerase
MTDQLIPAWLDGDLVALDKLEVHRRGLKHPAISVFVMDGPRTLIQRRALSKYHTPGLWANTCCTHPYWAETPEACATRRLAEELGITGLRLTPAGEVEYRADVGGGLTEHEVVHIFTARAPAGLAVDPNPDEVAETRWVNLYDLAAEAVRHPARFTPWLRIYLAQHMDQIFAPHMRGARVAAG